MGALQSLGEDAPASRFLLKGLGIVLLSYGILLLVGIAAGGKDPLQPLRGVGLVSAQGESQKHMTFKTIKTVGELDEAIKQANGRPVVLDFYADWCVSCKELEKYTFGDPEVQAAFAQSDVVLLQADVTENDSADQELLRRFGIIGPPAILFFGADGKERAPFRVVGYMPAEEFTDHFAAALRA
jgi:thiol:disulfide interchange protein DsbD